jgi:hypothetical protein
MGHFNACFKLAKILKQNHDVVFAGVEFFKDYVEGQGFMYYTLKTVPFGLGFEQWVNEQSNSKHIYLDNLKDRWSDKLYKLREEELGHLWHDLNPDYLFIDAFQSTDFIVLYPQLKAASTKVCIIQTMLPTNINRDSPPLNSLTLPNDIPGIEKAQRTFRNMRSKKKLKQKLQFFGMDDFSIINRRVKKNKLPNQYISPEPALQNFAYQQIDELILAPLEFDFPKQIKNFQHYMGFMLDPGRIEISDMEYFKIDSLIRSKRKVSGAKLIYCSFGSVKGMDVILINNFLERLFQVVKDRNYILIISLNTTNTFSDDNTPENAYVLKAAPQLQILEQADLFITHGGLNSIKESVHAGVPMLVYPLHATTDTMGNSTRVIYHQLGLRGDLKNDSIDDIDQKVSTLLADMRYKENTFRLREVDDAYEEKFISIFENLRPLQ